MEIKSSGNEMNFFFSFNEKACFGWLIYDIGFIKKFCCFMRRCFCYECFFSWILLVVLGIWFLRVWIKHVKVLRLWTSSLKYIWLRISLLGLIKAEMFVNGLWFDIVVACNWPKTFLFCCSSTKLFLLKLHVCVFFRLLQWRS